MEMEWFRLERYSTRVQLELFKEQLMIPRREILLQNRNVLVMMHACTLYTESKRFQPTREKNKENEHAARHSVDPQFLQEHDQHLSASSPKLQLASNHKL